MKPRSRDERLKRPRIDAVCVGDDSFPHTCPRCGEPAKHLILPYYDSPWREHGGICGQCAQEADAYFAVEGWPEWAGKKPPPTPPEVEQGELGL